MKVMKAWRRGAVAVAVAAATASGGYALNHPAGAADARLGPGLVRVDVNIEHSRFSISDLKVRTGTLVQFILHNNDPIHHEFILGPPSVHAAHERGTEAVHPPRPGEVSLNPEDVGETFYRFDTPGRVFFACHLPGHLAYGMHGWVEVSN